MAGKQVGPVGGQSLKRPDQYTIYLDTVLDNLSDDDVSTLATVFHIEADKAPYILDAAMHGKRSRLFTSTLEVLETKLSTTCGGVGVDSDEVIDAIVSGTYTANVPKPNSDSYAGFTVGACSARKFNP